MRRVAAVGFVDLAGQATERRVVTARLPQRVHDVEGRGDDPAEGAIRGEE